MNDTQRITQAQETLYKWCLKNLPVGRKVTDTEKDIFIKLHEANKQSRKHLFGHEDYVWYIRSI